MGVNVDVSFWKPFRKYVMIYTEQAKVIASPTNETDITLLIAPSTPTMADTTCIRATPRMHEIGSTILTYNMDIVL